MKWKCRFMMPSDCFLISYRKKWWGRGRGTRCGSPTSSIPLNLQRTLRQAPLPRSFSPCWRTCWPTCSTISRLAFSLTTLRNCGLPRVGREKAWSWGTWAYRWRCEKFALPVLVIVGGCYYHFISNLAEDVESLVSFVSLICSASFSSLTGLSVGGLYL